jgi:hypothetical protein
MATGFTSTNGAATLHLDNTGRCAVQAFSSVSPSVHARHLATGAAVHATALEGYGVVAQGGIAPLWLQPSSNVGAPTTGQHYRGHILLDRYGRQYICVEDGAPGRWVRPGFNPLTPARICDTRPGRGTPYSGQPVGPNASLAVTVAADHLPVPLGTTAVAINLTATGATAGSYVTVYPNAEARPVASSINFSAAQTIANGLLVKVSPDGAIRLYNASGYVHLIVDVMGYYF